MTEKQKKENEPQRKMQQLLVRAMKDEAWRQELLANPQDAHRARTGHQSSPGRDHSGP